MIPLIEARRGELERLCVLHRVVRLDLFGSAATGAFRPGQSDLDFIARFEGTREPDYAERFCGFADALEALFGTRVDLLTERMIRNALFREEVERTRLTVYKRTDEPTGP